MRTPTVPRLVRSTDLSDDPQRHFAQRYATALAVLAVLLVAAMGVAQWYVQRRAADARVVNVAGRQRMLSQRLGQLALRATHAPGPEVRQLWEREARRVLAEWRQAHAGLLDGDDALGLPGTTTPALRAQLAGLGQRQAEAAAYLDTLAARLEAVPPGAPPSPAAQRALNALLAEANAFLPEMNQLVDDYEDEAAARVWQSRLLSLGLGGVMLVALVLVGLLVFRPMARRHGRFVEALRTRNRQLQGRTARLEENRRRERLLYSLAAQRERSPAEQLRYALRAVASELGAEVSTVARIEDDTYTVVASTLSDVAPGMSVPLSRTYCSFAFASSHVVAIEDVADSPLSDHPARERLGLESYIADTLIVAGTRYGTVSFSSSTPTTFSEADRRFVRQVAQWVEVVLEREQQQDDLSQSQRLLTVSQRLAHVGGWHFDLRTGVIEWTPEMYTVYDVPPSFELETEAIFNLHAPEDAARLRQMVEASVASGEGYEATLQLRPNWRLEGGAGRTRWVHARAYCDVEGDPNAGGTVTALWGTVQDVTERVEREAELEAAHAAARASEAETSSFLSTVTHDLRSPMTAIHGFAQILQQDEDVDTIFVGSVLERSADRVKDVIANVQALARADAGGDAMPLQPVDAADVAYDVVALMQARAEAEGVTLGLEGAETPAVVRGHGAMLYRVLTNLVGNALKYTSEGGRVQVAVVRPTGASDGTSSGGDGAHAGDSLPRHDVADSLVSADVYDGTRGNDRVCLVVADTGVGMSEALQRRLFEPFAQAEDGQQRLDSTGLGMSITRRLVAALGGTLRVESAEGEGTTVCVALPVADTTITIT
jgi:signal transduction histidine kinase